MPTDLSAAAFRALLDTPGLRAVSFDVFDTALVRSFARPADLFAELGHQLRAHGLTTAGTEHFSHLRVQAEAEARRDRPDAEPRLAEIHDVLARRCGWTGARRQLAEKMELVLERSSASAVPQVRGWIAAARAAGKAVAFVSDMYLPETAIRAMLTDAGLAAPSDPVLVSCEHRVSKSDGVLYDRLAAILGVIPGAILHVGDHERSDGSVPRAHGLRTLPVRSTRLGFFEQRFLAYQHDTAGLSGRLAATSRLARLAGEPDDDEPALAEIGAGLLGPWLTCFALWTFERARRAGIKRLYFVSRDGQVMRDIAQAVQRRHPGNTGIECRYLHGSRVAWHQAAMTTIGDHQLRWLLNPQPAINAAVLASRLGFPPARLHQLLALTPAEGLLAYASWGPDEIACVASALRRKAADILAQPEVAERRDLARRYLVQEGLDDDSHWAAVELGWSGSMMASLHEALGRPPALTAYYLNLSTVCPDLPAAVNLESFAINPGDISGHLGQGLRFAEMIEVLTAADHGTVLGYEDRFGQIRPRLKGDSPNIWPLPALTALRAGAMRFVAVMPAEVMHELTAQLAHAPTARILVHQLLVVLADFMNEPPPELARAFTRCRFSEDPVDHGLREFVRPLAFWPVLRTGWRREHELWSQGTLACTPPLVSALARGGPGAAAAQLWRGLLRRSPFRSPARG